MEKIPIATATELGEGQTIKFKFVRKGRNVDGFVARFGGEILAYDNVCRHIPVRLDSESDQIFSQDGNHFICQNHGALYEPASGMCVRGPCKGHSLRKLKIELKNGEIWLAEND